MLHGGETSADNSYNQHFFRTLAEVTPDGGNILLVYFSREKKEYERLESSDHQWLARVSPDCEVRTVTASEEMFLDQVRAADTIYFRGGDTKKLLESLQNFPDFANLVEGKTLAGSSAGAYALCSDYVSASTGVLGKGLAICPMRVVCHIESPHFPKQHDPLGVISSVNTQLPLIVLGDSEWTGFTLDMS